MRSIRLPNDPAALRARLQTLEAKITSLLIQLADTRQERDALKTELERLRSLQDADGWRLP
jgi:hypothetical protein